MRLHRIIVIVVIGLLLGLPVSGEAISYTITDLGTLGSSPIFTHASTARGINNRGQVVGEATEISSGRKHAFLWTQNKGMQDLGTLGGKDSNARRINDFGQVIGESDLNTPGQSNIRAFIWDRVNGMQNIGSFGGHSFAYGINNLGQVVGGSQEAPGGNFSHAFIWDSVNGMQNLNNFLPVGSTWDLQEAWDINESGQIVGWGLRQVNTIFESHHFLWDPTNGIQDLGRVGHTPRIRLNDLGQATGQAVNAIAFLWDSTNGKQSLGTLSGSSSFARGINDFGQVVGRSNDSGKTGFLYSNGTMSNLQNLIPTGNNNWRLEDAHGINNRGQIVGWGNHSAGGGHAFLMTPIPVPSTLLLFSIGLLGIIGIGWRREAV